MADGSSDDAALAASWHQLEIYGIIQSVLCALFGTFFYLPPAGRRGSEFNFSRRLFCAVPHRALGQLWTA